MAGTGDVVVVFRFQPILDVAAFQSRLRCRSRCELRDRPRIPLVQRPRQRLSGFVDIQRYGLIGAVIDLVLEIEIRQPEIIGRIKTNLQRRDPRHQFFFAFGVIDANRRIFVRHQIHAINGRIPALQPVRIIQPDRKTRSLRRHWHIGRQLTRIIRVDRQFHRRHTLRIDQMNRIQRLIIGAIQLDRIVRRHLQNQSTSTQYRQIAERPSNGAELCVGRVDLLAFQVGDHRGD